MKTRILQRLLLPLLLMMAGETWALWTDQISFEPVNRAGKSGNVIMSAGNASNQYALAIADMSTLDGIKSAGFISLNFNISFVAGSRWQIGIGNKDVRGTNANGSSSTSYNTTGLMLQIGDDGNYFRVKIDGNNQNGTNGSSAYNEAFGRTIHVEFQFNRNTGKFNYRLSDAENSSTIYFQGLDIATTVEYVSIVEAYTWANNASVTLSNITINYNFFFNKSDETIYIEDLVYNNPLNNGENRQNVNVIVDNTYLRRDGDNYYPIKTTGSQPTNVTEGDYTTVTATATDANDTRFRVRIKTRNELDPTTMYNALTNTFEIASTLGMFTSQVVNMEGMTLYLGYQGHTPVVRSVNGDFGITIIDTNGWTFGNYAYSQEWGTVYKISTSQAKNLTVTGYFVANSSNALQLYDGSNQAISGKSISNPGNGSLVTATFALDANQTYLLYVPISVFALKSLSYRDAYFDQAYGITTINSTFSQAVSNMENPTYSIVDMQGEIASSGVTINSSTGEVSNITAGGALKIQATGGGKTCAYYLTVAYPATDYPGHYWNFCTDVDGNGNEIMRQLDISDNLKTAPTPIATTTDSYGEEWRFEYKNANTGVERDPRWYRTKAVDGDNAFIVHETNGLVFVTGGRNFYLRNDPTEFTHIGIRGLNNGASFTIPALQTGDIIEIMWRHDSSGSGSAFTATNVTDLRNKDVDEEFLITESARRGNSNTRFVGYYSFIAKGGDVTFTLRDNGNCDIQSIRIYKGPYRSTMRNINLSNNTPAPTTMLLDNVQQTYTYNYCNQLYSTATGPAVYVLKGYRKQTSQSQTIGVDYDHTGCVTGSNASKSPEFFTDENAYPVSDEEKTRLYELRKNIIGLEMYNDTWQSANNSYNNGVIKATSGWGKVTVRMNNYTNDMKYVIGYTPDYTITFGSAPHQEYPYTWDFTHISAQQVTGLATNAYNSIRNDWYTTNWDTSSEGVSLLNVDNSGDTGSQYVPGAILVTTERALSKYSVPEDETALYALDELDGLGVNGQIAIHGDLTQNASRTRATIVELLKYNLDDGFTATTELTAGSGTVYFGADKYVTIDHSQVDATNDHSYQLDGGGSKYIRLTLPYGVNFEAGNTITIKAYSNKANGGVTLHQSAETDSEETAYLKATLTLANKYAEETLTYTVSAGDGIEGQHQVWIYRANGNTTFVTEMSVKGTSDEIPVINKMLYAASETTLTIPDLNADGKQDWIYVSASAAPSVVTNATIVTSGTDGPDANQSPELEDSNAKVYKYKVDGNSKINAYLTFAAGTKIYKIGVTHILKDIHSVGGTGWATEIRKHEIDHELTGYFTKNDVNAYVVTYDSYDMKTATVALTPINEDGYVPTKTGVVMKLDNVSGLTDANNGVNVPLFYPSYTRPQTTTPVDFPTNNRMYNVDEGIENNNRNGNEQYYNLTGNGINYTKFVLTNIHWTYTVNNNSGSWSGPIENQDAAGFYRLHIWNDEKDIMPAHNAFMLVETDNLPRALWEQYPSSARQNTIGIRSDGDNGVTDINEVKVINSEGYIADDIDEAPWFTLSGMKLSTRPTKPGLYIYNNRKVVIK